MTVLSPTEGTLVDGDDLEIRFRVEAPEDDPPHKIRAFLDGEMAGEQSGFGAGAERRIIVPLTPESTVLMLLAYNRRGCSAPAVVQLSRRAAAAPAPVATLRALVVGVSVYAEAARLNLNLLPTMPARSPPRSVRRKAGSIATSRSAPWSTRTRP